MLTTTTNKMPTYTGNGVADTFGFTFPVFDASDIVVYQTDTNGIQTLLVAGVGYTVVLANDMTGSVVTTAPLASGYKLDILAVMPLKQDTQFRGQPVIYPAVLESRLDKIVRQIQQIQEQVSRSFKVAIGAADNPQLPVAQEGYVLGWVGGVLCNLGAATAQLAAELLSSAVGKGASLITYIAPYTGAVARTQAAKNSDIVSALDLGIKADGATDDLAKWNAAVAGASALGMNILLPAGLTSLVSGNIIWKSNVFLIIGAGASIKLKSGSADNIRIIDARGNLSNIGFFGPGCIDGNKAGQAAANRAHGLAINATGFQVIGLEVKNINCFGGSLGDGIVLEPQMVSPFAQTQDGIIDRCYIHDCGRQGLTFESGVRIRATNNLFKNMAAGAIDLEINNPLVDSIYDVVIANNQAFNCQAGYTCVSAVLPVLPGKFERVRFVNNQADSVDLGYAIRSCKFISVEGGTLSNIRGKGFSIYGEFANGITDISIENVSISGTGTHGIHADGYAASSLSRIRIKNVSIPSCNSTAGVLVSTNGGTANDLKLSGIDVINPTASSWGIYVDQATDLHLVGNTATAGAAAGGFYLHNITNQTVDENTVISGATGFNMGTCAHTWWGKNNDARRATTPFALGSGGLNTNWHGVFTGSFTMSGNQINVNDPYVDGNSIVSFIPYNASAATLQAGATFLWSNPAFLVNNTSLRIATANAGAAAGTEVFQYVVVNP